MPLGKLDVELIRELNINGGPRCQLTHIQDCLVANPNINGLLRSPWFCLPEVCLEAADMLPDPGMPIAVGETSSKRKDNNALTTCSLLCGLVRHVSRTSLDQVLTQQATTSTCSHAILVLRTIQRSPCRVQAMSMPFRVVRSRVSLALHCLAVD